MFRKFRCLFIPLHDQIDIANMSITKAKYHAPVRSSRDAPEPVELAFERVEKESTGASASRFSTILATDLK